MKALYKIAAVLISVSLCVSFCSVPSFADTGGGAGGNRDENFVKYTVDYLKTVYQYCKDVISSPDEVDALGIPTATSDYLSKSSSLALDTAIQSIRDNLTVAVDALSMAPSRETVNAVVERGRDLLDYCGIDYGKTTATENVIDMKGYGCCLYFYNSKSGTDGTRYNNKFIYGEYGKISNFYDYSVVCTDYIVYGPGTYDIYYGDFGLPGSFASSSSFSRSYGLDTRTYPESNGYTYVLYGDWRYDDGTSADDKTTPTQNTVQTNDPSSLTDTQLIELLEDLLLNLKLDYPDLSSVEGLLSAILSKLGTLDSDNDNGLLSDIYVAIQSLKTDSHPESQQIIVLLEEIRDNLTGTSSGSGETSDLTELTEILKDMKKSLNYLVGIETIDVVTDAIDLDNIDVTEFDQKFFDKYGSLITTVINKFGYGPVNEMLKTCHSIVFNTSAPADLTINYEGVDYTILSSSMFNDDKVKSFLTLVKSFLSIFILIGWLSVMRRRITSSE